jgi:hypothetical protein
LEIYFIQRFILFLNHPLSSIAVVLSSFLVFAGLGSSYSKKLSGEIGYLQSSRYAIVAIFIFGLLYLATLDKIFDTLMHQMEFVKALVTIVLIAPIAFAMGMPFPMGLSALGKHHEELLPWAWAVNGCASVIAAISATLAAIHFGFAAVMILALLFYFTAFAFFPDRS